MMKKIVSMLMAICLVCALSCVAGAANVNSNIFYYGDKEIIVEGQDLSYEEMKEIADYIAGENNNGGISAKGLTCSLFGHNISESTVKEITHNVYSTAPKCVKKTYKVRSCSRCDYIEKELISSVRVNCH